MTVTVGIVVGFVVRYLAARLFTVNQNERAVKTSHLQTRRQPRLSAAGPEPGWARHMIRSRNDDSFVDES